MLFLDDLKPDSTPYQDFILDVNADPKLKAAYEAGESIQIGESLNKAQLAYPD